MTSSVAEQRRSKTPIRVDVAMFGGPRAGKTSLLASMYRGVRGEVRRVGLGIRRQNPETMGVLDAAHRALEQLPQIVSEDPGLMSHAAAVAETPPGRIRRFDFTVNGADVDVATLSFYDFSGEDIRDHAEQVTEGLRQADILFVAINTPAMMEAFENSDYEQLHLDWNLVDHLDYLLDSWSGPPPKLVMLCPIKSERWLHDEEGAELLHRATIEMYRQTLSLLERDVFEQTTVVLAPVETVGSVAYRGLDLYDPGAPPSRTNVVFTFERRADSNATWAPRYHEQPFRWALLNVTRAVDYGALARGTGGGQIQKLFAGLAERWENMPLPKINSIETFWDNRTGMRKFRTASAQLAEGRLLTPPFHLLREGALLAPSDQ